MKPACVLNLPRSTHVGRLGWQSDLLFELPTPLRAAVFREIGARMRELLPYLQVYK